MAFFYNSVTKTFLFAPRETPPYVPGAPDEPSFGLIRDGDLGARDCCCCPCCAVPEGSQIYVCTNGTKKRRCINDGGTPNCSTPTCQPDTCCNGACCQGTSCSITADVVCQQLGGVFKGCGTTCGATTCDEPCPPGRVLCGTVCCPEGYTCVDGQCMPPCLCECYEVGVKGRWDSNTDAYSDPNNEFWSTGTANDCGYAQGTYGKLDYPVTIGGYTVTLNAGGVAVSQSGSTTSGGGAYDWPDAVLTYDANGCPNGIDLGEPVWTCNASEEVCNEVRQFLDDNAPEINLRACPENPLP